MVQSEAIRQVVEGFLADRQGHWLAHDVTFRDRTGLDESVGRASAVLALHGLFRGWPLARVRVMDTQLVVDANHAAASWVMEFDEVDGTDRVPMAATFEVRDGEIVRLDLLYDSAHRRDDHDQRGARAEAAMG